MRRIICDFCDRNIELAILGDALYTLEVTTRVMNPPDKKEQFHFCSTECAEKFLAVPCEED